MQYWHKPKIAHLELILSLSSKFKCYIRQLRYLMGYVLNNKCAAIVGCSCYNFELGRSANSKWQFFSCATIAFSERYYFIVLRDLVGYLLS